MANWHVALNETSPVQVITSAGGGSTIVFFTGAIDGSSLSNYPGLSFVSSQGQASSSFTMANFAAPPDIACGVTFPANTTFCATVSTSNGTLQPGPYFAQLLVSITDPVSGKTTQRQATVPLQVNTGTSGATPSLASTANNCSGAACNGTTGSTLQINGGLSEQFSVTLSMTCTNPLNGQQTPCAGVADLAIHDAANTQTTALGNTNAVPTNTPLTLRVGAALDPNGNISTGPASGYAIGINGVQHSVARGSAQPPDPVGTTVPLNINVGDLAVTANTGANSCSGVVFNGAPLQLTVQWTALGGFNSPTLSYEWLDGSHSPVSGAPLSFSNPGSSVSFSGGYSPVSFTLTNTQPRDGVTPYFLAVTLSSPTSPSTATKYFPFYFDLSLGQNFCGAVASARSIRPVQGSWSRNATGVVPIASIAVPSASSGADIHIVASDVSFTPSLPKVGDALQVRFRATNAGDADAKGMPIALQINGVTVAADTFDVPKGHSVLGGLTWTATADVVRTPSNPGARPLAVKGRTTATDSNGDAAPLVGTVPLQAAVVVDPQHLMRQKTALEKSAALSHLSLRGTAAATAVGTGMTTSSQRILIELEDGACVGLRLSIGGTMPCGSADLEITIGDLAKSLLNLESLAGVSDAGMSWEATRRPGRSEARYGAQAAGMSGHSYSVQLANGSAAMVKVESVRNPAELDAKAQAVFRASAARIMRSMGGSSTPSGPGDLTGNGTHATVFIVLNVQGM